MKAWILSLLMSAYAWSNEGTARQVYVKHKALHAVGGMAVAFCFTELGFPKTGLALVLLLAIGKETFDKSRGGAFRVGDIAWTVGPATVLTIAMRW